MRVLNTVTWKPFGHFVHDPAAAASAARRTAADGSRAAPLVFRETAVDLDQSGLLVQASNQECCRHRSYFDAVVQTLPVHLNVTHYAAISRLLLGQRVAAPTAIVMVGT